MVKKQLKSEMIFDKNFDNQVQRNLMGKRLEKEGNFLKAMSLCEANISENFISIFPNRRLAILYSKRKLISERKQFRYLNLWISQIGLILVQS